MVEVCAQKGSEDLYDDNAVRVSGCSRNHLTSAEAAFNFVHLLSHLTASIGGVCFQSASVLPSSAQWHFNPVINEILHEWSKSSSDLPRQGTPATVRDREWNRIHVRSYTHKHTLEQEYIPSREGLLAVAKLFCIGHLGVYLRREDIPALLQLSILEPGEQHLDYSAISAFSTADFTADDLCGVVKVGSRVLACKKVL